MDGPNEDEETGSGADWGWQAERARLALALAVMKTRPPGVTGREHAEALRSQLWSQGEGLRSRVHALQEEVLRVRQELLIARMTSEMKTGDDATGDALLSPDLLGPQKDPSMGDTLLSPDPLGPQKDPSMGDTLLSPDLLGPQKDPSMGDTLLSPDLLGSQKDPSTEDTLLSPDLLGPQKDPSMGDTLPSPDFLGPQKDPSLGDTLLSPVLLGPQKDPSTGDTLLSPDLPGPQKDPSSLDLGDSGCGTENVPETGLTPAQMAPPKARAMLLHMHFLQSLCGLRRARERGGGLGGAWFGLEKDPSVLCDTLQQLLGSVVVACKDELPLPAGAPVLEACQVLAEAMDLWRSHGTPSAQLVDHVEESARHLTGILFHRDHLHGAGERLTECLVVLGSSRLFRSRLIPRLLGLVNSLADRLIQACQVEENREPEAFVFLQYQNSFYLLWTLEQLLQRPEVRGQRAEVVGREMERSQEQKAFLGHLEHSLLLLSDEFPLFALYMWRIGALLSSPDSSHI